MRRRFVYKMYNLNIIIKPFNVQRCNGVFNMNMINPKKTENMNKI